MALELPELFAADVLILECFGSVEASEENEDARETTIVKHDSI